MGPREMGMTGYVQRGSPPPREADPATLSKLRGQLSAWREHCHARSLNDRIKLMAWLAETFTREELAAIIDSEIGRDAIRETYLREEFGP